VKFEQKISCIIPAYNEETNIGRVLSVIKKIDWIDEIIVVDDASVDKTSEAVKNHRLKNLSLVCHKTNLGKGAAMATGVGAAKYNMIVFIDSDLLGLTELHLLQILSPIIFTCAADLSLGVFALKNLGENTTTKFANRMFPSITGQRAIWKKSLPDLDKLSKSRYGADLLITKNVPKSRRAVVKLNGLAQVKKEEKTDIAMEAFKARIKMYKEVVAALKDG